MSVSYDGKKFKIKVHKNGVKSLDLTKRKISEIFRIENLNSLTDLDELILDNNQISKIQGLDTLVSLKKLSLKNNNISKIEGLENLKNLEILNLEDNKISEIKGLENLVQLKELNLWNNQISELKGLENLQNLKLLRLYGNPLYLWIKTEISPVSNIAQAAVAYCKKLKGKNYHDPDALNNFLAINFDNAINLIQKEDYYEFFNTLKEVYNKALPINNTIFYDFLGNILKKIPDLFNSKFLKDYNFHISKLLLDTQIIKMERYILNKFCSFENEYILTYFLGYTTYKSLKIKGRIFITNLRIIILGEIQKKDDSGELWPYGSGMILLDEIIDGISLIKNRKVLEDMNFTNQIPIFGYNFPLYQTNNCSYTQNTIRFSLKLPQNKKNKKIIITIIPKDLYFGEDDVPISKLDVLSIIYNAVIAMKEVEN